MRQQKKYMLNKTIFKFDLGSLKELLNQVEWDEKDRCNLNKSIGHWLYDPYEICDKWKGTAFDRLLKQIPYDIGEARLMKLEPQTCYRAHSDADDRLHINILSNEYSYLIDLDNNMMYGLKEDGCLYYMDGAKMHTAVNFGSTPRIQLVIRVLLKRSKRPDHVKTKITFVNPPYNLRYLIDRRISPLINRYTKTGEIGFFDLLNANSLYFEITPNVLDKIHLEAKNLQLETKIERIEE